MKIILSPAKKIRMDPEQMQACDRMHCLFSKGEAISGSENMESRGRFPWSFGMFCLVLLKESTGILDDD